MNRIDAIFAAHRKAGSRALMPFLTAGYPNLAATEAMLPALQDAGASICELGVPFSDPIADGPVIQASMTAALGGGVNPEQIFEMVARVRPKLDMGLVAMVSYSIPYRIGVERFVARAAEAGFDGIIFPDLPLEEAPAVRDVVTAAGLTCSFLIAPTTPDDRAEQIARACTGFIYVVARTGITGERSELPADLAERLQRIRNVTDLPITVGFGISTAEQVRTVTEAADAAIVGSALVRYIGERADQPADQLAEAVGDYVRSLCEGLETGARA